MCSRFSRISVAARIVWYTYHLNRKSRVDDICYGLVEWGIQRSEIRGHGTIARLLHWPLTCPCR